MKITRRKITASSKSNDVRRHFRYIRSAEEVDEDDLEQVDQEFTSRDTSINSSKLPAIYKLVNFPKGSLCLDYGGGRFDNGMEWLAEQGVEGYVYDPYNRSAEHNREVVRKIRENGGADITLCSNVLNVIKEPEARINVLKNMRKLTKPSGTVYITVYEGNGKGEGKQSKKDSYQLNRKTADYLEEIQTVFPDAQRKGKLIFATPTGKVTASCKAVDYSNHTLHSHDKENIVSSKKSYDKLSFKDKLESELHRKLVKTLTGPDFGFLEDEVDQYSVVEIRDTLDGVRVEVRAELSYDGMVNLAEALDPIIQSYDPDAYFDQDEPGIMDAYLQIDFKGDKVTSAVDVSVDDISDSKTYDYEFDFEVEVTEDMKDITGNSSFFPEIYDDYYDFVVESDSDFIVENLLSLVDYNVPEDPGTYRVSGIAKLTYHLDDIYPDYGSNSFDTSNVFVDFDYNGSWIENLQVEKIS